MIYLCEYDGSISSERLQRAAEQLPLQFPDNWRTGLKWEKSRQRIIAWLLLAYSLTQELDLSSSLEIQKMNTDGGMTESLRQLFGRFEIRRDRNGKPYSCVEEAPVFNISHCDTACACILSQPLQGRKDTQYTLKSKMSQKTTEQAVNWYVGIDVEKKFPYKEKLERHLYHERERAVLQNLEQTEREHQQQLLWSLKESLVKLDGRGLAFGLNRIDLSEYLPITEGEQNVKAEALYHGGKLRQILHTEAAAQEAVSEVPIRVQLQSYENYTLAACTSMSSYDMQTDGMSEPDTEKTDSMTVRKITEAELDLWINSI